MAIFNSFAVGLKAANKWRRCLCRYVLVVVQIGAEAGVGVVLEVGTGVLLGFAARLGAAAEVGEGLDVAPGVKMSLVSQMRVKGKTRLGVGAVWGSAEAVWLMVRTAWGRL